MHSAPLVRNFCPLDELESSLLTSWREVTRAEYRFLKLLREFDLRRGWQSYGNNDCAEWLNWRCGISRTTAQEKVRVAQALWVLPEIDEAFRNGDLSYSKVRALTRVATEVTERDLVAFAVKASAAQCEDYCRRLRNGDPVSSAADAQRLHDGRSLVRHLREDGSGTMTVELPRESLELVLTALERVGTRLPEDPNRSLFAKAADALVQMARETLAGDNATSSSAEGHQVVVHVDASALSGKGGESELPLPAVKRLCCDGPVVAVVEQDGRPLDVGRKQRTVPIAIKRALLARDRRCTFPGCHHERFLEAHHVHHWADGGETSLANLLLVCSAHHTLIHEGGFSVQRHRDGTCYFARPDGRLVESPSAEDRHETQDARAVYRIASPGAPPSDESLSRKGNSTMVSNGQAPVRSDNPAAKVPVLEMVAVLDRHMHGQQFIVGDKVSVADFNAAFTLDWANEDEMLDNAPSLRDYLKSMYARPAAPPRIAEAFAALEN